jgi:hypothetical protein
LHWDDLERSHLLLGPATFLRNPLLLEPRVELEPLAVERVEVRVPVLHEADVIVVLAQILEQQAHLAPEGVEELLLVELALKEQVQALVVLPHQIAQKLPCLVVFRS